jgi:hypothetical protein
MSDALFTENRDFGIKFCTVMTLVGAGLSGRNCQHGFRLLDAC